MLVEHPKQLEMHIRQTVWAWEASGIEMLRIFHGLKLHFHLVQKPVISAHGSSLLSICVIARRPCLNRPRVPQ
ncbi:hypothetical protein EJB05_26106 [Eragrostis curvula]|uniref:Uncharacterized protein n=1 Tax=Eragrostis curvula TaxID=38414 RepID=A0A5J9UKD5_9POAL|nr:hypothetical protein EJB05_26106 [Eragrostis curvula]